MRRRASGSRSPARSSCERSPQATQPALAVARERPGRGACPGRDARAARRRSAATRRAAARRVHARRREDRAARRATIPEGVYVAKVTAEQFRAARRSRDVRRGHRTLTTRSGDGRWTQTVTPTSPDQCADVPTPSHPACSGTYHVDGNQVTLVWEPPTPPPLPAPETVEWSYFDGVLRFEPVDVADAGDARHLRQPWRKVALIRDGGGRRHPRPRRGRRGGRAGGDARSDDSARLRGRRGAGLRRRVAARPAPAAGRLGAARRDRLVPRHAGGREHRRARRRRCACLLAYRGPAAAPAAVRASGRLPDARTRALAAAAWIAGLLPPVVAGPATAAIAAIVAARASSRARRRVRRRPAAGAPRHGRGRRRAERGVVARRARPREPHHAAVLNDVAVLAAGAIALSACAGAGRARPPARS